MAFQEHRHTLRRYRFSQPQTGDEAWAPGIQAIVGLETRWRISLAIYENGNVEAWIQLDLFWWRTSWSYGAVYNTCHNSSLLKAKEVQLHRDVGSFDLSRSHIGYLLTHCYLCLAWQLWSQFWELASLILTESSRYEGHDHLVLIGRPHILYAGKQHFSCKKMQRWREREQIITHFSNCMSASLLFKICSSVKGPVSRDPLK